MSNHQSVELLRSAVEAARAGNLQQARGLAERGLLGADVDATPFHAFLGMLLARTGDLNMAISHLQRAHQDRPGDVTIACNLIAVLMDAGHDEAALAVATADLAFADPSLRIARYRGFLAQKLERFADARQAYDHVVARNPDDVECWNNLGNARAALEDHAGAVEALHRAVELDPKAAPTRLNLATALQTLDRLDEAETVLLKAANDFPQDARALAQLYGLYKKTQRHEATLPVLEQAVERDPDDAGLQLKLAIEYGMARRTDEAEQAYRRVIALDPAGPEAYLGLAIQYEHMNREAEFAPLIASARANGLAEGPLAFIETLELRRAKRFEEGLARLAAVPVDVEPQRTAHVRATLLERLNRTDEAFAAYREANSIQEADPTEPLRRAAALRAELAGEIAQLTPEWKASWRPVASAPDGPDDPVFLVGFPRSGTTLLDTILMGHPQTVVMEEQPPLNHVDDALGGMTALPQMDDAAIAAARTRYFEHVATIQPVAPGQLLIDKSPLFLHKVPLITRLFPNARFILALRHPCDVVLSCFMSNFRLNSAMANFLRIEDAAALYDLVFSHWEKTISLFSVNLHTVVYERLVEDVDAEVRPLLDWLGLDWHADVLEHRRTALARGLITTASYSQVTEPIYKRASGRWQRYRHYLEPVMPTLKPWIDKFSYTD